MTNLIFTAIVTAYVSTGHPCSDGHMPSVHHTIAAPRNVALHSIVIINGERYEVEDRTARRYNGRFDIFVDSKAHALAWGKQVKQVMIITK